MKKPEPTYRLGDDQLFRLFDVGEMEHVCDLVRESCDPVPKGHRRGLAQSLTRFLLRPVESFIDRLHETGRGASASEFDAADELRTCVENVAKLLTMSDDGTEFASCTKNKSVELAADLSSAWTKFIAYAGAYRMYDALPRELETNNRKTERMRDERDARAYAALVDHRLIIARYAELLAAKKRGIRRILSAEFELSESMVSKIWNNRDKYETYTDVT